jgi:hypothetical protein
MANQPMVPGMMPGFNLPAGPGTQFSPELLAQLAAAGFQPPGLMGGGGGMPQQQTPGFNIGDGMAGLGAGLAAYGKANPTTDGKITPEGNISNFPQGGGPKGPSGGAMAPGVPNGADPLSGIPAGFPPDLWKELFGSK